MTTRPTGPARSPTGSPTTGPGCTCCTGRGRRGSAGPTSRASAGRSSRDYAYVLEMDCDFSHDPASVPSLLDAAIGGADLVLGSRYVAGGGVEDWGLSRRVISAGGCLYARAILGVRVRDLTGGFKCFRRAVLERIPLDDVDAQGYMFQIEMTYRAIRDGFTVVGGADHLRRSPARGLEDVAADRARGGAARPRAAARSAARPALAPATLVRHATHGAPDLRRRGGARRRIGGGRVRHAPVPGPHEARGHRRDALPHGAPGAAAPRDPSGQPRIAARARRRRGPVELRIDRRSRRRRPGRRTP